MRAHLFAWLHHNIKKPAADETTAGIFFRKPGNFDLAVFQATLLPNLGTT